MTVPYLLVLWGLLLAFVLWWIARQVETAEPETPSAPPPDPIVSLVDKWAHDWERGRF